MVKETVMVICAHPDDEVLGVGGTMAKYAKEGKNVIVVLLSSGESSHIWMKKTYTKKLREEEAKKAHKLIGVKKTIFLHFRDGMLMKDLKQKENQKKIIDVIKKYNPSKIFTHSHDDMIFPDHKAVSNTIKDILKRIKYIGSCYVFNIWNITSIRKRDNPKMIVDISSTFKTKMKALSFYKSQKVIIAQLSPLIWARAIKNGMASKSKFAEKFYRI